MLIKFLFVISVSIAVCNSSVTNPKADKESGELLYRLPSHVIPSNYDLKIKVDVDNSKFEGDVSINIEIREETKLISINYKDIDVAFEDVVLKTEDSTTTFEYENCELTAEYEIAVIHFKTTIPVGFYIMTLSFAGKIRDDLKGLYKSTYATSKVIATTHFEPSYARMAFPCFDEPHFKATFKLTVLHDMKFKAISNMPVIENIDPVPGEEEFAVSTFNTTLVMSTYLVAFIVSDYKEYVKDDTSYVGYAPPGKETETDDSIQFAPKAMKALENFLGVEYQLSVTQLASINDFLFGAMENWGLVTFRSEYLLYPNSYISPRIHQHSRLLISHEFAHMWFGNAVTPDWWTFVWLSEGFAQFFQYYTTDELEPSWKIWQQFNVNNLQSALSQDDKNDIRIMSEPIIQASSTQFDYVVYAKSSSIIRMFYEIIGKEAFKEALNLYITEHSNATVVPENLFESFQVVIDSKNIKLPTTFKILFESWSNELGYPVVNADIQTTNNKIVVSQKRFFVDPDLMLSQSAKGKYYIPITVATDKNDDSYDVHWLLPNSNSLTIDFDANGNFVVLNKLQAGYYRVNYNEDYWLHLANFLSDDTRTTAISEENRAQLIDDASNLAKAGLVSYEILFKLLHNLQHDSGFLPWMAASNAINFLTRMLLGSAQYGRFENFLRIISNKNYEAYKIQVDTEKHVDRLHRLNSVTWACQYGNPKCVEEVRTTISAFIADVNIQFADEIRPVIFCTMARYIDIDDDLTQQLIFKVIESFSSIDDIPTAQINEIIMGLGCTRNETNIVSLFDLASQSIPTVQISAEMRARIAVALVNGSYEAVKLMIQYLTDNFAKWRGLFDTAGTISILNALGPRIVTEDMANAFNAFIIKNNALLKLFPTINDAAIKAQTTAVANLQWRNAFGADIEKWLQENIDDLETDSSSIVVLSKTILFISIAAMLRQF